jgi:hypothetical protein
VAPRPSSAPRQLLLDEGLSLTAMLEMFEPSEHPAPTPLTVRETVDFLRESAGRLWEWLRNSSRRAARWGAVAGATEQYGNRSAAGAAEVAK